VKFETETVFFVMVWKWQSFCCHGHYFKNDCKNYLYSLE